MKCACSKTHYISGTMEYCTRQLVQLTLEILIWAFGPGVGCAPVAATSAFVLSPDAGPLMHLWHCAGGPLWRIAAAAGRRPQAGPAEECAGAGTGPSPSRAGASPFEKGRPHPPTATAHVAMCTTNRRVFRQQGGGGPQRETQAVGNAGEEAPAGQGM